MFNEYFVIIFTSIPALITAFLALRGFKGEYDRERYERLISPIFIILEPHLFRPIDAEIEYLVREIYPLITENQNIVGGNLLFYVNSCKRRLNKNSYNNLCSEIDREHTKLCRRLGIPGRSVDYRIRNHQYRGVVAYICYYGFAVLSLVLSVGYIIYFVMSLCAFLQKLLT